MKEAVLGASKIVPAWGAIILLLFQFAAPFFYFWQNSQPDRIGGKISRAKSAWLIYVLTLWLGIPLILWQEHWLFRLLAISMLIRGLFEIPLCKFGKWRVWQGLSHDAVHFGLCLWGWSQTMGNLEIHCWLGITMFSLLCEMLFVLIFKHATDGPKFGIFFVPDEPRFAWIHLLTDLLRIPQHYLLVVLLTVGIIF